MSIRFPSILSAALLLVPSLASGDDKPRPIKRPTVVDITSMLAATNTDALAGSLRGYLVRNVSPILYEASPGWGTQKEGFRGVKWTGKGLRGRPEVVRAEKNHGTWKKVRVTADNLKDTLILDIRNVQHPEPGRTTFDVFVSFDARVDYEQQSWKSGICMYGARVRARFRVKLTLSCELVARLEAGKMIVPDAVFRLRVLRSNLKYDNLVVEHLAGMGGETARLLGDAIRGGIHRWQPALEPALLHKANEAVIKAGDTREVRIGLVRLLGYRG